MLSVVSLFTGAGGLDLGLEAAGFCVRACIERDEDCRATLHTNRPRWYLPEQRDIFDIDPCEMLAQIGIRRRELTFLTGGPPCQPFSKSGYWVTGDSARLNDPRAKTLSAYMRFVEAALPQVLLLENVKGLAFRNKDEGLHLLRRRLSRINKRNRTHYDPVVLHVNAADYGVPQMRERIFVVASRDGTHVTPPDPTHAPHAIDGRARYRTAWDAIGDLPTDESDDELALTGKWADLLPTIPEGANYLHHTPHGAGLPLFGWRTRYWSFLLKLAKQLPSWTLQAVPGPATGPFHWRNRLLSARELARLQTFPDDYEFIGARRSVVRQIGNAVPPAMGEVLGIEIKRQLLGVVHRRPQQLIVPERNNCPAPEQPASVPRKYLALRDDHPDHPGTGRGPRAEARNGASA